MIDPNRVPVFTQRPDLEVIGFNQSNYPLLIEVYEVNEDYVLFASNGSRRVSRSKVQFSGSRAYFRHYNHRIYLDETFIIRE